MAKELRKSNREVSDRLRKLKIEAKTNLSSISQENANEVRISFGVEPVKIEKPKKKPAKKAEKKKSAGKEPAKKPAAKKKADVKETAKKAAGKKPAARKPAEKKASAEKKAAPEKKKEPEERVVEKKEPAKTGAEKKKEKPQPPVSEKRTGVSSKERPLEKKEVHRKAVEKTAVEVEKKSEKAPAHPKGKADVAKKSAEARKQPLRVAPRDERGGGKKQGSQRKVYRFGPGGRSSSVKMRRPKSGPSTVAPKLLRVPSGVTVKEFAQRAGLTPSEVIRKAMEFGEMLTLNQSISNESLKLLSEDIGVEIKVKPSRVEELEEIVDRPEDKVLKPPVVTVMGHVDHGKTRLLDAIRKTDVMGSEMGGITQHIGAYQINFEGKNITFIDTPGHESFTSMRARGAQITDIAVLVVAADDGVMPQTLEALDHALEAQVPVIVAVNKIDKPEANPHLVRQQLSEKGLVPEEWGGENIYVDISAKAGDNVEHLLEMIVLVAEIQELKAVTNAPASGTVIEARLDKAKGTAATILVQRGTVKIGDVAVAGTAWGKIRAIFDDHGNPLKEAGPAKPVEILGLSNLPMAGDEFRVVEYDKKARQIADRRRMQKKIEEQGGPTHVSLDNLFDRIKEGELNQFKIVLKADTQGSLEAIAESLDKVSIGDIQLKIIHSGVGAISETDVMLATASDAIVIGFHVVPDLGAAKAAELEKVDIRTYQVIYQLTEEIEAALVGMLEPEYEEVVTGRVEVRQTFRVPGAGTVAGLYVLDGVINRNSRIRVARDGVIIHDGRLASLKRFKDDVKSVSSGFECGAGLVDFQDVKVDDIFEVYEMRELER
ncbi:MAG: translation initiation factor IF-2 [Actinobacteria bacterium]|nr:translation initiation factor IF-2 [Actinomycetota bacterium]